MAEEALARIRANLEARMAEREDRSLFDDAARADATTGPAELVALERSSTELRETAGMSTFLRRAQVVRDRKAREQVPDVHGHGATSKKALYDRDDRKSGKAAPADDAAARGGAGWQASTAVPKGAAPGRGLGRRRRRRARRRPRARAAQSGAAWHALIAQEVASRLAPTRAPRPRSSSARAPTGARAPELPSAPAGRATTAAATSGPGSAVARPGVLSAGGATRARGEGARANPRDPELTRTRRTAIQAARCSPLLRERSPDGTGAGQARRPSTAARGGLSNSAHRARSSTSSAIAPS